MAYVCFFVHFRAFLHFMEDCEPALSKHTRYMRKMHKHILGVCSELLECGTVHQWFS